MEGFDDIFRLSSSSNFYSLRSQSPHLGTQPSTDWCYLYSENEGWSRCAFSQKLRRPPGSCLGLPWPRGGRKASISVADSGARHSPWITLVYDDDSLWGGGHQNQGFPVWSPTLLENQVEIDLSPLPTFAFGTASDLPRVWHRRMPGKQLRNLSLECTQCISGRCSQAEVQLWPCPGGFGGSAWRIPEGLKSKQLGSFSSLLSSLSSFFFLPLSPPFNS